MVVFWQNTMTLGHITQKFLWFPLSSLPHMFSQGSEVTRIKGCCGGENDACHTCVYISAWLIPSEMSYIDGQILTISANWPFTGLANNNCQSRFVQRLGEKRKFDSSSLFFYPLILSGNATNTLIQKWCVVF